MGQIKRLIDRGQSGPDRADWKKQSLVVLSMIFQDAKKKRFKLIKIKIFSFFWRSQ